MFLCDEFDELAIVHASLVGCRLVTTPKLIAVLVRKHLLAEDEATAALNRIRDVRS
jgi:hypothetical protein